MKPGFKIKTIHAFIATEDDGTEGIIGMQTPDGWMPFVAADSDRLESLRPYAIEIAKAAGTRVTIAEFSIRKDVEVLGVM